MKLADFIREKQTLSPLMEGRNKIDVAALEGEEITITAYDRITNNDGTYYYALTVAEDPNVFFFGGMVLSDLCDCISVQFKLETLEDVKNFLATPDGEMRIKLVKRKANKTNPGQKSPNDYWGYEIVSKEDK